MSVRQVACKGLKNVKKKEKKKKKRKRKKRKKEKKREKKKRRKIQRKIVCNDATVTTLLMVAGRQCTYYSHEG